MRNLFIFLKGAAEIEGLAVVLDFQGLLNKIPWKASCANLWHISDCLCCFSFDLAKNRIAVDFCHCR